MQVRKTTVTTRAKGARNGLTATFTIAALAFLPACTHSKPANGFQVVALSNQATGTAPQQYVAFVPQKQPDQPLSPVLLYLNGFGENGSDGLFHLSNTFGQDLWRRRNQLPLLVVCPQCADGGKWTAGSPETKYAFRCVDDAISRFGGDSSRVYITGVSAGGTGVMELVSAYPDRFTAALPVSCGSSGDTTRLAAARMPIRCLANRLDKPDLLDELRKSHVQWLQAGLSPVVTEVDGVQRDSHNAWEEAYSAPISFWWLMQQQHNASRPSAAMQLLQPRDVIASWTKLSDGDWHAEPSDNNTEELVGQASEDRAWLISPVQNGESQLHLDAFLNGTQQIRLAALASDTEPTESIEFVIELPDAGTSGVREPTGQWSRAIDPPSQQSLLDGWNDIRLTRSEDTIHLELNGWPAATMPDPWPGQSLHWGIASGETLAPRFRFLRMGPK